MSERLYWYMRDNHTFRRMPDDMDGALHALVEEFDAGYTHGMLCTKVPGFEEEHAGGSFKDFLPRAHRWITALLNYKSPADLEVDSWELGRTTK